MTFPRRDSGRRLWPFGQHAAVLAVPGVLIVALALLAGLRGLAGWPGPSIEGTVLTGVLIISVIPLVLTAVDLVAGRGGSLEYAGVKISFAAAVVRNSTVTVPANIGVRGVPVTDSGTTQILDTLRNAVATQVVVVDLEDGRAWWETRLLVLCAGATRRGRPEIIVFTAIVGEVAGTFQGWAVPGMLLDSLLRSRPHYRESYALARAATRQWELGVVGPILQQPPHPLAALTGLAATYPWMAFAQGSATVEPNEFAFEQYLAADLGAKAEQGEPPRINPAQLHALFDAVLHQGQIDQNWSPARRLEAFLESDDPHTALTERGRYVGLLNHRAGVNAILTEVVGSESRTPP